MSKNYLKGFAISIFAFSVLMFGAFHYANANFITDLFGIGSSATVNSSSNNSVLRMFNLKTYKTGSGIVTSIDGKINCGKDCRESYSQNTVVTLNAEPSPGFTFMGWSTGWFDKSCPGVGSCTLTMNKSKYARAYFKNSKRISANKKPKASGDAIQGGSSSSVSSSGESSSSVSSAVASVKRYELEVKKSGIGSVKSVPEGINCVSGQNNRDKNVCKAEFPYGQIVQLYANPDKGSSYETGAWGGDCRNTSKDSPCRLEMNKDRKATVSFDLSKGGYKLTVIKLGNGDGSVESMDNTGGKTDWINCGADCSENIKSNCESTAEGDRRCTTLILKATAVGESTFGWWDGDCKDNWLKSAKNECVINMDDNKEVKVVFNEGVNNQAGRNYKLTVSPRPVGGTITNRSGNGRIDCGTFTSNCSSNYGQGLTVNLVATSDVGYTFGNWGGACSGSSTGCAVKMGQNKTVSAVFNKIQTAKPQGTVSAATNVTSNSATLNGKVNPAGKTVKVNFVYWRNLNGSDGLFTPSQTVSGESEVSVKADVVDLSAGATYVYNMNLSYFDETTNTTKNINSSNSAKFTALSDLGEVLNLPHLFIISDDNSSIAGEVSFTDKNGVKRTCSLATKKYQCFYGSDYFNAGSQVVLIAKGKSSGISAAEFVASKSKDCVISKTISEKDTCTMTMRSSGDTQTATVKFSDITGGLFNSSSASSVSSGSASLDIKVREVLTGGRFGNYADSITLSNPNSEGKESVDLTWTVPSDASNCSLTYTFNAKPLQWGQLISSEIIAESGKDRNTGNYRKHSTEDYDVNGSSSQTATYTLSCRSGGMTAMDSVNVTFGN